MLNALARSEKKQSAEFRVLLTNDYFLSHEVQTGLRDAFIHLCNNSLDHAFGHDKGSISIETQEPGDQVLILYSDSGRGLPLSKIREKAVATGAISTAGSFSDIEVADFIFLAGLSTAESLSHSSGRGVGMNAVKATFEKLGAKISIEFTAAADAEGFRKFRFSVLIPKASLGIRIKSNPTVRNAA